MTTETAVDADPLRRSLKVVVPADDMKAALDTRIEEVRAKAQIKGFRPGKVPAAHIRKLYGPSIMREIIEKVVRERSDAAIAETAVRPIGEPRLLLDSDLEAVTAGGADLAFTIDFDVMPSFEAPDPAALKLERPVAEVADAQIEEALATLAERNRGFEAKDGPAESGDQLVIDFVGRIDGEAFDGGSADGAELTLGSNQFIPGFEDQLIGAAKGEEREVLVSFPEDYPVESLKGKAAAFEVIVQEVRAPGSVTADDALATRLGFDDLEALKTAVRGEIEREHAGLSRAKAKRALFDQLDGSVAFPLPQAMVEAEFAQIWAEVERERARGEGDPDDAGKTEEELKALYRGIAERRVRLGLVLAEIGNKAKIQVRDEELAGALRAMARRFPGAEQQVIERFRQDPAALAQLRAPIFEEKVVDYILELAEVTDRPATREELLAEDPLPA